MKRPIVCWLLLLKNHRMEKLKMRSMLPGTHGVHCVSLEHRWSRPTGQPGAAVQPLPERKPRRIARRPTPFRRRRRRSRRCAYHFIFQLRRRQHPSPPKVYRFPVPSQSPTRCSPGPDRPPTCSSAVPWHRCSASPFHPRLAPLGPQ